MELCVPLQTANLFGDMDVKVLFIKFNKGLIVIVEKYFYLYIGDLNAYVDSVDRS